MNRILSNGLLPLICVCLFVGCNRAVVSPGASEPSVESDHELTNYPVADLRAVRAGYAAGKPEYVAAVAAVVDHADKELTGEVYTIVNKAVLPPSGVNTPTVPPISCTCLSVP